MSCLLGPHVRYVHTRLSWQHVVRNSNRCSLVSSQSPTGSLLPNNMQKLEQCLIIISRDTVSIERQ